MDHQLLGECWPARKAELAAALPLVHHGTSGEGTDLAMLGEDDVEAAGVLHRPAHQQGVLHTGSVVGEQVDAGLCELAERGELLAGAADGDASRSGTRRRVPARPPLSRTNSTTLRASAGGSVLGIATTAV